MLPQNVKKLKHYVLLALGKRSNTVVQDRILATRAEFLALISKLVRILSVALTCCRTACPV